MARLRGRWTCDSPESVRDPRRGQNEERAAATAEGRPPQLLDPEPAGGLRVRLPDRRRQPLPELLVEDVQLIQGFEPLVTITMERRLEARLRYVQAREVDVAGSRDVADRSLARAGGTADPLDDPLEDSHVLAVPGPEESPVAVAAEPVHAEDLRRIGQPRPEVEPVSEVVGHVVAAKRNHGHGIPPHDADLSGDGRRGL